MYYPVGAMFLAGGISTEHVAANPTGTLEGNNVVGGPANPAENVPPLELPGQAADKLNGTGNTDPPLDSPPHHSPYKHTPRTSNNSQVAPADRAPPGGASAQEGEGGNTQRSNAPAKKADRFKQTQVSMAQARKDAADKARQAIIEENKRKEAILEAKQKVERYI